MFRLLLQKASQKKMHSDDFFLTGKAAGATWKQNLKARSSGGERYPDTVEVGSSNLPVPTINTQSLEDIRKSSKLFFGVYLAIS